MLRALVIHIEWLNTAENVEIVLINNGIDVSHARDAFFYKNCGIIVMLQCRLQWTTLCSTRFLSHYVPNITRPVALRTLQTYGHVRLCVFLNLF